MKARLLQALLGAIGPLILHIINTLVNKGVLEKAVGIARLEVERLAGDHSLDNATKRQAALKFLDTQMKILGVELTESLMNLAVELAVAAAKSKFER